MAIPGERLTDRRFLPVRSCADGYGVKYDGFPINIGLSAGYKHACFVCDGARCNNEHRSLNAPTEMEHIYPKLIKRAPMAGLRS